MIYDRKQKDILAGTVLQLLEGCPDNQANNI